MSIKKDILKKLRVDFREGALKRDNNKCVICRSVDSLDVHHITNRNDLPCGGYVLSNAISLCPECHKAAELYLWRTKNPRGNPKLRNRNFSPEKLYNYINSSFTEAYVDCLKMKEEFFPEENK